MAPCLIEAEIERLLRARARDSSICPSEVARALAPLSWRPLMPAVRAVARALAQQQRLVITQGGTVLDASLPLRGAVRLKLPDAT